MLYISLYILSFSQENIKPFLTAWVSGSAHQGWTWVCVACQDVSLAIDAVNGSAVRLIWESGVKQEKQASLLLTFSVPSVATTYCAAPKCRCCRRIIWQSPSFPVFMISYKINQDCVPWVGEIRNVRVTGQNHMVCKLPRFRFNSSPATNLLCHFHE